MVRAAGLNLFLFKITENSVLKTILRHLIPKFKVFIEDQNENPMRYSKPAIYYGKI